jgi:hypothetical protein
MVSAGIHQLHESSQIIHTFVRRSRLKVVLPSVTGCSHGRPAQRAGTRAAVGRRHSLRVRRGEEVGDLKKPRRRDLAWGWGRGGARVAGTTGALKECQPQRSHRQSGEREGAPPKQTVTRHGVRLGGAVAGTWKRRVRVASPRRWSDGCLRRKV